MLLIVQVQKEQGDEFVERETCFYLHIIYVSVMEDVNVIVNCIR